MALPITIVTIAAIAISSFAPAAKAPAKQPDRTPEEVFTHLDANGDGQLDPGEFRGKREGKAAKRRAEAFRKMDRDGSGGLSPDELRAGFQHHRDSE
ncbi:MAG: EF-hand domain-containing protein [Nannocystaceae bacterium]|nr:EF-hand domain-containing protein [Nannocystaceae bacterium]